MRKGLKKAVVLGLSAGLALTSVAGCSKKDKFNAEEAVVTVNDATVPAGVLNLAVRYNQAGYESMYMSFGLSDPFNQDLTGTGTTLGADLKSQLATQMANALLAEQKMDEYGVSLSDEDREQIKAAAAGFMADNEEDVLKKMGVTQEIAERYLELVTIQTRVEREMTADVDTEVSDEEAAQRRVQYVLFTPETETEAETENDTEAATEEATEAVTEAESGADVTEKTTEAETEGETAALTGNDTTKTKSSAETEAAETETEAPKTEAGEKESDTEAGTEAATEKATEAETETEDPETAAAKERARVHAAEMIEKVKDGGDFEAIATEMGKTASSTTFGSDYSLKELVTATDGLADGTLVEEPIETANGYYVVKLVSQLDRDATDNAKTSIVNQRKSERVTALYNEWTEAGKVSVDSEVLEKIIFDYHLTLPEETETEAVQTEAPETEAETETESETSAK